MENKKFIYVTDKETAHKLRYLGFKELPQPNEDAYVFLNAGIKIPFDATQFGCLYTNKLHF